MLRVSVVLGIAAVLLSGCDERPEVARASIEIVESFPPPPQPPPAPPPARTPAPRLYIDASASMAGYVGCNERITNFDHTLARLAAALGTPRVILFGEGRSPRDPLFVERNLDRAVHCPELYNRLQNPDFRLIEALEQDSVPSVAVYLTDGVQSASADATPTPTVVALQRWIRSGHSVGILAFSSQFKGRAWSERIGQMLGHVDVEERPFYAFILAPDDAALDATLRRLPPDLRDEPVFVRLGQSLPTCRIVPARYVYRAQAEPSWAFLAPRRGRSSSDDPSEVGEFECILPDGYPLSTVHPEVRVLDYRHWTGRGFGESVSAPAGLRLVADSFDSTGGVSRAAIVGILPDDQRGNFGLYTLAIETRPGRMREDLVALSTDDDGSPENFDRTFRFLWLLDHLVRAQLEESSLSQLYFITTQYR